ncbi:MAG TPA: hypothetical protein VFG54_12645 [Prolixibacteraceae bacterium]|nr:hypothetical protein [Prolixibacteraceae bacterium]
MELFTIALAVLAISISVYTMVCQKQKIQTLERKIEEYEFSTPGNQWVEPLKAKVRAQTIRTNPGSYTIRIFNVGPSIARNVKIEFNPRDYNDLIDMDKFPYPYLKPQDSTEVYLTMYKDLPGTVGIKMQWDDENEFNNEHMQVITL